jgi:hypothetical protein
MESHLTGHINMSIAKILKKSRQDLGDHKKIRSDDLELKELRSINLMEDYLLAVWATTSRPL